MPEIAPPESAPESPCFTCAHAMIWQVPGAEVISETGQQQVSESDREDVLLKVNVVITCLAPGFPVPVNVPIQVCNKRSPTRSHLDPDGSKDVWRDLSDQA